MQRNHGDREIQPKPIHELIEEGLQLVKTGDDKIPEDLGYTEFVGEADHGPIYAGSTEQLPDIEPAVRLECARIAATSFGGAGCFDDEALLVRAEAIFKYTRDGLS